MNLSKAWLGVLLIGISYWGLSAQALGLELGVMGGVGMTDASGTFIDQAIADLVAAGSLDGGTATASYEFTPSWMTGIYAHLRLLDWFKIGLETRLTYLGSAYLAKTDKDLVWERYSLAAPSLLIPLSARFVLPLPELEIELALAPALGVLAGDLTTVSRLKNLSFTESLHPSASEWVYAAFSAEVMARWNTGIGYLSIGLVYDAALSAISPATLATGSGFLGATLFPGCLSVYGGWGYLIPIPADTPGGR